MNLFLGEIRSGQVMITCIKSNSDVVTFLMLNCHSFIVYFVIIMDCLLPMNSLFIYLYNLLFVHFEPCSVAVDFQLIE